MFAVKHVEDNGYETTILAKVVSFYPHGEGNVGDSSKDNEPPMVVAYGCLALPGLDDINRFAGGEVFVMNDSGKTVSRYRLRPAF